LTPQEPGKAPIQQVYVPKKAEVPVIPLPRARPRSVVTIGFMEAPVINHDEPIVIEEIPASKQDEVLKKLLELKIRNAPKVIPSTANPYGVLVG
jgi:hypothetical protein